MIDANESIDDWLRTSNMISRFCTQNGWIDGDSVRHEVSGDHDGWRRINVYFTEMVMEGSGCVADQVQCFGQVDLRLGRDGRVEEARPV